MDNAIYGFKLKQDQAFDDKGLRVPVTLVKVDPNYVVGKDLVVFGHKKEISKPWQGMISAAFGGSVSGGKNTITPRFMRKLATQKIVGEKVNLSDIFNVGDNVKVTGTSIGKGFAGVVKRHGFKGGPKTHGQSDRQRAPGSIGQSTTPGRVYKGKRMAGHMGVVTSTVKNLKVFSVDQEKNTLLVTGLVPGASGGMIKITKI